MKRFSIAVIGMGQRGLCILERLSAVLSHAPIGATLSVHIVDPAVPGQGIHEWTQPDHLLINTIAGQAAIWCDSSVTGAGPIVEGPTFLEWARAKGLKKIDNHFVVSEFGDEIDENTYLPRSLLGEYLTWAYDRIVKSLPDYVTILNHRREAVDITKHGENKLEVHLEGGFKIDADFVFMTTGHGGCGPDDFDQRWKAHVDESQKNNSLLAYYRTPYPITRLNAISSEARVAVCGTGLTTTDIVSALTSGLGGVFVDKGEQRFEYVPCGREPKITLFSRQGLPASGRAINEKGVYGQYKAKFFTIDMVNAMRQKVGSRQLDWDLDLLPILKKEMAYVYSCAESGEWTNPADFKTTTRVEKAIEAIIAPLVGQTFSTQEEYEGFLLDFLREDISECFRGNESSPLKAAADMLRDIRDNIRYAVDYGGLTPESHAKFLEVWCSISNRIASGPPKERGMELLALMEAGIVEIFGPRPKIAFDEKASRFTLTSTHLPTPRTEHFDVLLRAKVELFRPETSTLPLFQNMIRSGMVAPYANGGFRPGGVQIDEACNIVTRDGRPLKNFWALGYVVEGPHFYTYVLPRPYANSRGLQDAGKSVLAMMRQIDLRLQDVPALTQEVA